MSINVEDWDDAAILGALAFERLHPNARHMYPPLGPFSIVAQTRNKVKGFEVSDMRHGGRSVRTLTKRKATRIAKLIERDCYGGTDMVVIGVILAWFVVNAAIGFPTTWWQLFVRELIMAAITLVLGSVHGFVRAGKEGS